MTENNNEITINISPANVFVHVAISDAEGKQITEFNLSPFDALSVANSLSDSSIIARVRGIMQEHENMKNKG